MSKKKMWYIIKKWLFTLIGDTKWAGWKRPLWITINAASFMLKGKHYRKTSKDVQPGDILVRRFEGYIDKWLIPGWFNHAGIYVGNYGGERKQVIHAISNGVVVEDLIDFMRTDHLIVLRPPAEYIEEAVACAKGLVGREYDFEFDFTETLRFSCTELVAFCYDGMIEGKKRFGRHTVVADDIVACPSLLIVWDSTDGEITRSLRNRKG